MVLMHRSVWASESSKHRRSLTKLTSSEEAIKPRLDQPAKFLKRLELDPHVETGKRAGSADGRFPP